MSVDDIRKRLSKAAPGPYEVIRHDSVGGEVDYQLHARDSKGRDFFFDSSDLESGQVRGTAEFIAHAREDIEELLKMMSITAVCDEHGDELSFNTEEWEDGTTVLSVHRCHRCADDSYQRGYYNASQRVK